MQVFVCSNPKCGAVYSVDPRGHCPLCRTVDGVGFSTRSQTVRPFPPQVPAEWMRRAAEEICGQPSCPEGSEADEANYAGIIAKHAPEAPPANGDVG